MKHIVVPIDFSADSLKGLDLAMLFTRFLTLQIKMVYVQMKSADLKPGSSQQEYLAAEKNLKKIVADYSPKLENDSKLDYIIKKGKIFEEVVNQVHSYQDGIITASTHGASGFEEFFIGSNAYKILTATYRPVITIRKGKCPDSIKKIVLPIDITPETRQKVPYTCDLAALFNAEIHVITVSSSRSKKLINRLKAYSKQVASFVQGRDIEVKTKSLYGDNISDLTVNYANAVDADMISIMSDQGGSLNVLLGSNAHEIINKATIPVLCITPRGSRIIESFQTFGYDIS